MSILRRATKAILRTVAPGLVSAIERVGALDAEIDAVRTRLSEVEADLALSRRENDDLHRASQRIAELTDLVVSELAAARAERRAPETEAGA